MFDPAQFYLATAAVSAFGHTSTVNYDAYSLAALSTADALGNTVAAEVDYRLLAPTRITDPNGNHTDIAYDTLGMPVAIALLRKYRCSHRK